jgi:hypothetical protein
MTAHYNIATEGIRAGHLLTATLGFGSFVQIIVQEEPYPYDGGSGLQPDREKAQPRECEIKIVFYGRKQSFWFEETPRNTRVKITVNRYDYTVDLQTKAIIDVRLVSSKVEIIEPPIFIVKEIKHDSVRQKEQPRILVKHRKLD